jgi:hypothetical protein
MLEAEIKAVPPLTPRYPFLGGILLNSESAHLFGRPRRERTVRAPDAAQPEPYLGTI